MDIALVKPPGYLPVQPLEEVVESVKWGLEPLGMLGPTLENQIRPQVPTILFGANLLSSEQIRALPDSVIIYNLEQLDPSSPWFPSERFHALSKRSMLWDYSLNNLSVWKASGLRKAVHVPIGYAPVLTRVERCSPDIDVLFYGSIDRRKIPQVRRIRLR